MPSFQEAVRQGDVVDDPGHDIGRHVDVGVIGAAQQLAGAAGYLDRLGGHQLASRGEVILYTGS